MTHRHDDQLNFLSSGESQDEFKGLAQIVSEPWVYLFFMSKHCFQGDEWTLNDELYKTPNCPVLILSVVLSDHSQQPCVHASCSNQCHSNTSLNHELCKMDSGIHFLPLFRNEVKIPRIRTLSSCADDVIGSQSHVSLRNQSSRFPVSLPKMTEILCLFIWHVLFNLAHCPIY